MQENAYQPLKAGMRSLRLFYDFSQFADHIPDHGGDILPEHPVKQTVEIFVKTLRKEFALLGANALHSLLAGMGHLVQRKENIEITGEEFCHPVIDADQIPSFLRFRDLSVEGRQHTAVSTLQTRAAGHSAQRRDLRRAFDDCVRGQSL